MLRGLAPGLVLLLALMRLFGLLGVRVARSGPDCLVELLLVHYFSQIKVELVPLLVEVFFLWVINSWRLNLV